MAIIIPLAFLLLLGSTIWYVAARLISLFEMKHKWLMRVYWAALVVISMSGMMAYATTASAWSGIVYIACGLVFMGHVYMCMTLLVVQLVQRWRRQGPRSQAWTAIALAVGFTMWGALQANQLDVASRTIEVAGIEEGVTIMHISDVHLGHHRKRAFLERIVEATNQANPDFIVITGDLIDGESALDPTILEPLSQFNADVYYSPGNHETYIDFNRTMQLVGEQGIHILRNEMAQTHGIQLIGLDYMNADEETFDMHPAAGPTIKSELPKIQVSDDVPLFVLHHSPAGASYIAEKGALLYLAGHTHAGQVFPGTVLARFIFPFNDGLYDYEGVKIFVSNGAGTFGPRMRLGTRNAIHLLDIVPE